MKIAFAALLVLHGAIHLMGFAKAFGLAALPGLRHRIARTFGVLWLIAAVLFVGTAALLFAAPDWWWLTALPAIVVSQVVIVDSWRDAKLGTIANAIILVPLTLTLLGLRSTSFRSLYAAEVARREPSPPARVVTEAEIATLPAPVQTYLRRTGSVGRPRVHGVEARFTGAIRPSHEASWMTFEADQHERFDRPARWFFIRGSRLGVPFEALHVYRGSSATMQVRLASLFDVVDARGPEMDQSETVTLFNDMWLLAPSSLVDADIQWHPIDERTVSAIFTHAGHTVAAQIVFDADGDLADFRSNDRYQTEDGRTYRKLPWSTPVSGYREFDGRRLAAYGEGVWQEPGGPFVYGRFELRDVRWDTGEAEADRAPVTAQR